MNFALLGHQPAALPLLQAIAADTACRLASAYGESLPAAVFEAAPGVRRLDDWADLLAPGAVEAVIVAGGDDATRTAAKHLFASGRPLLVVPHPAQDTSWMYELALQQADARAVLMPYFPHREDAGVRRLREALAEGRIGPPRALEMERLVISTRQDPPRLSVEEIDGALVNDADLLRFLAGHYSQVTALRTGETAEGCLRALVTLAGKGAPEATWTIRPVAAAPGWRLTIAGDAGAAVLEKSAAAPAARLTIQGELQPAGPLSEVGHAAQVLAAFRGLRPRETTDAIWEDLIRAGETVDAARDSLRRRRTIDLYSGTHSEQTVFKTQMTAMGCGVLFLTLVGVILLAVVDAGFRFPPLVKNVLRALVFLPVFLFLLLQLLYFAARPARGGEKPE